MAVLNGKTRMGKTYLAELLIRQYQGRVLVVDGKEDVQWGDEFFDRDPKNLYGFLMTQRHRSWCVTYWPDRPQVDAIEGLADVLMAVGNEEHAKGQRWPLLLMVDEVFAFKSKGPHISPAFAELCRLRGKWGFSMVLVSQRPTDLPPDYLFDVSFWFAFRTTRAADLKRIEDDTEAKNVDLIRRLRLGQYGVWREEGDFSFYGRHGQPLKISQKTD